MGSVSADCVFLVSEAKAENDTKVVPCKWYSEVNNKFTVKVLKVGGKHFNNCYSKYSKCNSFQATTHLLNSENLQGR